MLCLWVPPVLNHTLGKSDEPKKPLNNYFMI